ncbi:MAG: DUF342 domain-containing protein [Desulfobacterales bacterium]|uniref:DUF342 domain-containing protein n=1 Tax=Candidatus Desulfatibia profunda TaxID=2841695 RepID=A0A8J6NR10_9BACT|nr:DUF342 domain-containing protein [Candidatus Desulfatibia profunda]MBL7180562.1 DUF342 domain-containing protein [Desulfobacterales bacterium]
MKHLAVCPACSCKYQVPGAFIGRKIFCKKCGTQFKLVLQDESKPKETRPDTLVLQEEVEEISQDDSYLLIGKLAVKYRFASVEQIKKALWIKERKKQDGQELLLGEILVDQGILSISQLDFLHSVQKMMETRKSDSDFEIIAVKNDFATQEEIDRAVKEQKRVFNETKTVKVIGDILVESGVLTAQQRDAILIRQKHLTKGENDEKRKPEEPDTVDQVEIDTEFELSISEDQLCAFIRPLGEVPQAFTAATIINFLAKKGINPGIVDDSLIEAYLRDKNSHKTPWKVAAGEPAKLGKDAEIKYYFNTDPLNVGTIKEGGSIDFKDRGIIPQVKKGDLLAEKIPAVEGPAGIDVYGNKILAPKPKDRTFRAGKGAAISEDGLKIFANTDGVPKISLQGKVHVLPQLEISSDVGLKTGHVDFDGKIHVAGGIQNGYRVKGHSLTADEILKAEVEMTGDIVVARGIIGAKINAGGNIRAIFMHEADIHAMGDIVIEKEIIDSNIETSGACIIKGGTILSSKVTARKGIWASQIGSEMSKPCSLMVGVDLITKKEIDKIMALIPSKKKEIEELKHVENTLNQESKQAENEIGDLAQLQDRSMVERRKIQAELAEHGKANDQAQLQNAKTVLQELDLEIKAREKNLEKLFNLQDRISEQLSDIHQKIKVHESEVRELEERITELTEWSKNGNAVSEVKVNGVIFQDTTIDGIYSSLILKQACKNAHIKEHKIQRSGGAVQWEMRVSTLK